MNKYINPELLKADIRPFAKYESNRSNKDWVRRFEIAIDAQPAADVREDVKGEWQPIEVQPYFKKHFDTSVAYSICHRKGNKRWNFCPNCGAQMVKDKP